MERKGRRNSTKGLAALALAAFLALGGLPVRPLVDEVRADGSETYLYYASEEDAIAGQITSGSAQCTYLTDQDTWEDGWYIVKQDADDDVCLNNRITVNGTVHLILRNGKTLTANAGITINPGATLNIYAQSADTEEAGSLIVPGVSESNAGIGGEDGWGGGNITIHGGNIKATSRGTGAAIGGGESGTGGTITINGGKVEAETTGIGTGAAIGGGESGTGGTITINGGKVKATSSGLNGVKAGAAIGGGSGGNCGDITINEGSSVTVKTAHTGAGIGGGYMGTGGKITINGGNVEAETTRSSTGAAIGGGQNGYVSTITITGGEIKATNNGGGAAIGGGDSGASAGQTITITGGIIKTSNGPYSDAAGIGGGKEGAGGTITIKGGEIITSVEKNNNKRNGAGIGGGWKGVGGDVTISGGTVTTEVAEGLVGIGGGTEASGNGTLDLGDNMYLLGGDTKPPTQVISKSGGDYRRYRYMTVKAREKAKVTFRVKNGSWNNGSASEIVKEYTAQTEIEPILPAGDIPAVGAKPASGYKEGSWDTVPTAGARLTKDTVFTYTYAVKPADEEKKKDDDEEKKEEEKDVGFTATLDTTFYVYDGKTKKPKVTVKYNGEILSSKYYSVKYQSGRKKVGTYKVTVTGKKSYKGQTATEYFTITQADNPLNVIEKDSPAVIKLKKATKKKPAQTETAKKTTLSVSKIIKTVKKGKGKVSYEIAEGDKTIFSISPKNGKLTVAKGTPAGEYTLKVNVTAAGDKNYKGNTIPVTVRVNVQKQ